MDVVGLLLDVGPSMGAEDRDGESCLERCKNILSMYVQRKIFSKAVDKLCLFTYGSNDTANELAAGSEYEHISMDRDLRPADWDLCSYIQNEIQATNHQGDFIDALIVVSTYLMNAINSVTDKKEKKKMDDGRRVIMIFSNLDNHCRMTDSSHLKGIIQSLKENHFEIHFIGPAGLPDNSMSIDDDEPSTSSGRPSDNNGQSKPKTQAQIESESVALNIISQLEGCSYDFREALAAVSIFENKKTNPMAWNTDLAIGSKLKIPISGFKMVTRVAPPSFKRCSARNPEENIEKKFDTFLPDDTNTEVDKEEIIKGYRYGTDLVPFTEDDMANMKYKCDSRELSLIGFTKSSNVKPHYFSSTDTMCILARKGDEKGAVALSALCKALRETESVGVIRKVYNKSSSPSIGALIPVTENGKEYMVYIDLPFMEDMRELEFPSLPVEGSSVADEGETSQEKNKPTQEQLDAVDYLIDCMDMSAQPEENDNLEAGTVPNPTLQRLYQVFASRAADESCAIPELSPLISNIVNNTIYSCRWIESEELKFKELFKLEKVGKEKKDKDNVYKDSTVGDNTGAGDRPDNPTTSSADSTTRLRDLNTDAVTKIGTIDPVSDFETMIKNPSLTLQAYTGMVEKITQLVTESVGDSLYKKALACLITIRSNAVSANDQDILKIVNDFLLSTKSLLTTKGPKDFWSLLVQDKITVISSSEASNSSLSDSERDSYLSIETEAPADTEQAPAVEDDEDMLDMM